MKRVKIMLTAIAVLAAVGGALAFNAKFNKRVCTAAYNNGCPSSCSNLTTGHTDPSTGTMYCYKVVANGATSCSGITCNSASTTITSDEN
jgi:hypothetical protein